VSETGKVPISLLKNHDFYSLIGSFKTIPHPTSQKCHKTKAESKACRKLTSLASQIGFVVASFPLHQTSSILAEQSERQVAISQRKKSDESQCVLCF
jgi:hypothetical protein